MQYQQHCSTQPACTCSRTAFRLGVMEWCASELELAADVLRRMQRSHPGRGECVRAALAACLDTATLGHCSKRQLRKLLNLCFTPNNLVAGGTSTTGFGADQAADVVAPPRSSHLVSPMPVAPNCAGPAADAKDSSPTQAARRGATIGSQGIVFELSTASWCSREPPQDWSPVKHTVPMPIDTASARQAKRHKTAQSFAVPDQQSPAKTIMAYQACGTELTVVSARKRRNRAGHSGLGRLRRTRRRSFPLVRSGSLFQGRLACLPTLFPRTSYARVAHESAVPETEPPMLPNLSSTPPRRQVQRHNLQGMAKKMKTSTPVVNSSCTIAAPPQLCKSETRRVRNLLRSFCIATQTDEVLATVRSIPLTRKKLSCLEDGEWLNEEVINAWMEVGVLRQAATSAAASTTTTRATRSSKSGSLGPRHPLLHIPLTYFYSRLSDEGQGYDYRGVQRWFRKVELFPDDDRSGGNADKQARHCVDAVLVPLHLGKNHWSLMVIDLGAKKFCYFDSLHPHKREAKRHAALLWRWLCDEANRRGYCGLQSQQEDTDDVRRRRLHQGPSQNKDEKRSPTLKSCGWAVEVVDAAPRQHNGYDCGVFMLMCARSIALGTVTDTGLTIDARTWRWGQADMPSIRQKILADLVS